MTVWRDVYDNWKAKVWNLVSWTEEKQKVKNFFWKKDG